MTDDPTREADGTPRSPLTPEQILAALAQVDDTHPLAALAAADQQREAVTPRLLEAMADALDDPDALFDEDETLFAYALYLLAKWREPRAHPLMIRWLSLPGEGAFDLAGDVVTQDAPRLLAATCGGDLAEIKRLIVNPRINEWCRGSAIESLVVLAAWGEVPRESVVGYYRWLLEEGLDADWPGAWDAVACACADIEAIELFPFLRGAYEEDLLDPGVMAPGDLDDIEHLPRGETFAAFRRHRPPVDDVARATSWWGCFDSSGNDDGVDGPGEEDDEFDDDDPDDADDIDLDEGDSGDEADAADVESEAGDAGESAREGWQPPAPVRAGPKVGRNDPCPCGSGKKYKKCCLE
jgi:hypothetical protein